MRLRLKPEALYPSVFDSGRWAVESWYLAVGRTVGINCNDTFRKHDIYIYKMLNTNKLTLIFITQT